MITCDMQGGLGNIMFQVATAYALAKNNNDIAYFDLSQNIKCVTNHFNNLGEYKDNIFHKLNDVPLMSHKNHYTEPSFAYTPIPYQTDCFIHGYYQSEKYFVDMRNEILDLFEIKPDIYNYICNKYNINFDNYTSLHVRRGDYIKLSHVHHVLDPEYYWKALKMINPKNVMIFTDDPEWVKSVFKPVMERHNIIIIENEKDYIDMYMMSLCKNNIIANSSFSWWGAWLNKHIDKQVVCPSKWFTQNTHDIKDIYPEGWIKI